MLIGILPIPMTNWYVVENIKFFPEAIECNKKIIHISPDQSNN